MSPWSPIEKPLVEDKDELGDERPGFVVDGSASLQYIADMHLTISSESLLGVFGIWSDIRVPRCSAKLIILDEASTFWAYYTD